MGIKDDINRILRDHEGYTGDGRGGVGDLPIGDRSTARKPISKRDLREVLGAVHDSVADPAASAEQAVLDARAEADRAEQAVTDAAAQADRAEDAASGVEYPVSYAPQTLTAPQRAQARSNINTLEELHTLGIGRTGEPGVNTIADVDAIDTPSGYYVVEPSITVGTLPPGLPSLHGTLAFIRRATTTFTQLFFATGSDPRVFIRHCGGGTFGPWREMPSNGFATPAEALAGTATDKVMSPARVAQVAGKHYWQFTASGTWTKPAGLPDDTMVTVEMWGGGGGSGGNCGGGGGGYALGRYLASALPNTITVTIGSGGVGSTAGGNSDFGSILTAYGGGAAAADRGGGGGGAGGAGGNGSIGGSGAGGRLGGGAGGAVDAHGDNAVTLYGGGGGSGRNSYKGGDATYGGAGGAAGTGGLSAYGGNGGSNGQPGTAPGGGGGRNAAGARGEVRIWM